MQKQKKAWRERLQDDKGLPRVVVLDGKMGEKWGDGTLVIPAPRQVDELMRKVPKGRLVTINHIRAALAKQHDATMACPLTTGIFARIAAQAAQEDEREGRKRITPYWRTLKGAGELNPKYPGGCEGQKTRLEAEGFTIVEKGKRFFVANYEQHCASLEPNP